jgi:hypothetical protein
MTNFEIWCQLFHNDFPSDKALNEDVGWPQVDEFDVLLYKGLGFRQGRVSTPMTCSRGCPGERGWMVVMDIHFKYEQACTNKQYSALWHVHRTTIHYNMSSPFINVAISLGAMQRTYVPFSIISSCFHSIISVARRISFDDPEVLNYIRIAYVVTQIIVLGTYYYVSTAVSRLRWKND